MGIGLVIKIYPQQNILFNQFGSIWSDWFKFDE